MNNFVYWTAQIIGSIAMGYILDLQRIRRRARAYIGWTILLFSVFATHIWAYFYQKYATTDFLVEYFCLTCRTFRDYTRESIPPDSSKMDIRDPAYPARIWLYIFFGALDAAWQTYAYCESGMLSLIDRFLTWLCLLFLDRSREICIVLRDPNN